LKFRISQLYLGEVETEKPNVRDPLHFLYRSSISKNNYCPQLLQQRCLLTVSFVFHDSLPDSVHPLQNCSFNPMDHGNHFLAWQALSMMPLFFKSCSVAGEIVQCMSMDYQYP
jgi:hypothetical protein